jgi:hypothetical protein
MAAGHDEQDLRMTQAVAVRRDGDTFQARLFWLKAARLLDPESPIVRVGFESGPKGYDDIWTTYDPRRGLNDQEGRPLFREHFQCKWHVSPGSYGHAELVDPEFINANARSLLERALAAQRSHAPAGEGARFRLVTNWQIDRKDALRGLVHQRSHTLRLDRLFAAGSDRTAMGRLRKLWRDHLGITEQELRPLARTLAFSESPESLEQLRESLDPLLRIAGLRRTPLHESASVYDDVVFQWMGQERVEFDRATFRSVCEREGLIADVGEPASKVYGVKSFEHATDRLEDRCTAVLDLIANFDDRQIRPDSDWERVLYPALKGFLLDAAKDRSRLRLVLDAHLTLSFAAGSVLNIKSGRIIELEQRTIGKKIWAADDAEPDPNLTSWIFEVDEMNSDGSDIAVAVSLTHDTKSAVKDFVSRELPHVQTLLVARPNTGPGARSVSCGRHAFDLAEALTAKIRSVRDEGRSRGPLHLFAAGPGAFAFFLGQRQIAIGPLTLYEFDFEGTYSGSYEPSLSLPVRESSSEAELKT